MPIHTWEKLAEVQHNEEEEEMVVSQQKIYDLMICSEMYNLGFENKMGRRTLPTPPPGLRK